MQTPRGLLIRADGSSQIGIGHVMRCLALAQAWREVGGGPVGFAAATMPAALAARIEREGMSVHTLSADVDVDEIARAADQMSARHVVLDGYHFGDELEQALTDRSLDVVAIDDFGHARHDSVRVVVNPNIYARDSDYPARGAQTRLLLGTRYALLRREFWPWRDRAPRRRDTARNILVTTGGSDTADFSARAIEALSGLPVSARLIVGPSNSRGRQLEARAAAIGVQAIVDPHDMPEHMEWADIAVCAAGSTCSELLFMGVPAIVVALAANQRRVEAGLIAADAAESLGWHEAVEPLVIRCALEKLLADRETREARSRRGRQLVDGRGAERIARLLAGTFPDSSNLRVRPASAADEYYVWRVNNQPLVRQNSLQSEPIPYETHVSWFSRRLTDSDHLLLIAMEGNMSVGVIRFDRHGDRARISIALEESQQRRKLGTGLIALATTHCCDTWPVTAVEAHVRPENPRSRQAFANAGYRATESVQMNGIEMDVLIFDVRTASPR